MLVRRKTPQRVNVKVYGSKAVRSELPRLFHLLVGNSVYRFLTYHEPGLGHDSALSRLKRGKVNQSWRRRRTLPSPNASASIGHSGSTTPARFVFVPLSIGSINLPSLHRSVYFAAGQKRSTISSHAAMISAFVCRARSTLPRRALTELSIRSRTRRCASVTEAAW